jgi:hypothetical protein
VTQISRFDVVVIALAGLLVLFAAIAASLVVASEPQPTKGPIPPNAVQNGVFNRELIPDFIPALDRNGNVAGYVARDLAIPVGAPVNTPVPVYASDLKTLVGYMHPGRGFVPLGTSPDAVPLIPATVEEAGSP